MLETFALEYYGSAPSVPPQILVPRGVGRLDGARGVPLGAARVARSRCASPERGEKRRLQELADAERAARARVRAGGDRAERRAARRGARGAARGAQPRVAAAAHRVLRHLAHPGTGSRRVDGRLRGRRCRGRRDYRKFGIKTAGDEPGRLRRDGGGDLPPVRAPRGRDGGDVRRVVRDGAEPRRHRRRQGPAVGRARRDAGVRPAARRGDRAREADRGGLRARRAGRRSCSRATIPGLQLLQRIRDEAHRFALGFHRQRRERRGARVDLRRARRRRAGAAACASAATSAPPSRCSPRRPRSSRACPACRRRRRGASTPSCTRPAAPNA